MRKNLDRLGGLVHSQRVMLALTQKGVSREDSYRLVQRNAMPVWRGEGDFLTLLKNDAEVSAKLSGAELEELFDLGYHLKHVDTIFDRVFGGSRSDAVRGGPSEAALRDEVDLGAIVSGYCGAARAGLDTSQA